MRISQILSCLRCNVLFLCVTLFAAQFSQAATYYVSNNGDDQNSGLDQASAWRTIDRVNTHSFSNGDILAFNRGDTWYDVSIRVDKSVGITSYGTGPLPQLIGGVLMQNVTDECITYSHSWGVQLVKNVGGLFYGKVNSAAELSPGKFWFDKDNNLLCIDQDPSNGSGDYIIGSKNHVIELQNVSSISVNISDIDISYANRYGVSPWWQGGFVDYGDIDINNVYFYGNAFSAIALSGNATYGIISIANNTIRENGAEGIYIGIAAARESLIIRENKIGDKDDAQFGWRGEGAGSAFNGDGIDIKYDNKNVMITGNIVVNTNGAHGITSQSSGTIISHNFVINPRLDGEPNNAAISADIQGDIAGDTIIEHNTIEVTEAHGIALRGAYDLDPRVIVRDNHIMIHGDKGYSQIALVSYNNSNILIESNKGAGGTYGFYIYGEDPVNLTVSDNKFFGVVTAMYTTLNDISGMTMRDNYVCDTTGTVVNWRNAVFTTDIQSSIPYTGDGAFARKTCSCINSAL